MGGLRVQCLTMDRVHVPPHPTPHTVPLFFFMSQHLNQPSSMKHKSLSHETIPRLLLSTLSLYYINHKVVREVTCIIIRVWHEKLFDYQFNVSTQSNNGLSFATTAYSELNLSAPSCVFFLFSPHVGPFVPTPGLNQLTHIPIPSHMWNIHSFLHTLISCTCPHTICSLHLTTFCLQYKPTVIACVCIHLACKWSNWEIPVSTDGKHWWEYVDNSVTLELLDGEIKLCFLLFHNSFYFFYIVTKFSIWLCFVNMFIWGKFIEFIYFTKV